MMVQDKSTGTAGLKVRRVWDRYRVQEDITRKVRNVVMYLKNRKAGGTREVVIEMMLNGSEDAVEWTWKVCKA